MKYEGVHIYILYEAIFVSRYDESPKIRGYTYLIHFNKISELEK
jgi:hypothetical protein